MNKNNLLPDKYEKEELEIFKEGWEAGYNDSKKIFILIFEYILENEIKIKKSGNMQSDEYLDGFANNVLAKFRKTLGEMK